MDAQKNRAPFSFIVSTKDTHDLNALTLFNERVARLNRSRLAERMRDPNYVFLYDNDGHYSKLMISSRGGGTPGNPAWVELKWIYNKTASDNRF